MFSSLLSSRACMHPHVCKFVHRLFTLFTSIWASAIFIYTPIVACKSKFGFNPRESSCLLAAPEMMQTTLPLQILSHRWKIASARFWADWRSSPKICFRECTRTLNRDRTREICVFGDGGSRCAPPGNRIAVCANSEFDGWTEEIDEREQSRLNLDGSCWFVVFSLFFPFAATLLLPLLSYPIVSHSWTSANFINHSYSIICLFLGPFVVMASGFCLPLSR